MNILGYFAYAALIFMAVTWTVGVRVKLGTSIYTTFGALFYLVSAIIVGVSSINKLHSLWLIPTGFILVQICSMVAIRIQPLLYLIKILSSAFAMIVRLGIPASEIEAAQDADSRAAVERYLSTMNKKDK